jgi:predicted metal-dependent peptidase
MSTVIKETRSDETLIRDFKRKRIEIMRSPQFIELGPVMMMGQRKFTRDIPTACTNGRDEMYNLDFIFQWTAKEAGFINLHEVMHKIGRHLDIYAPLFKLDHALANRATDENNNYRLVKADPQEKLIAMPRDAEGKTVGWLTPEYAGMPVKKIFDLLREKKQEEQKNGGDGDGEGAPGGGFDEHDWEGASALSEEQKEELKNEVEGAIRQGLLAAKKAGLGNGHSALGLDDLLTPTVDWVEQLKAFVRATCSANSKATYRRIDRRFWKRGLSMPTLRGQAIKELVVAPDVSGSMFCDNSFVTCMSEVEGLAKQLAVAKIHLIYWDGHVCKHEQYDSKTFKDWRTLSRPTGGGGTDPACVSDYLRTEKIKPDAIIVLTDGEVGSWGNFDAPLLWAIHNRRNTIVAPTGRTIQLEARV